MKKILVLGHNGMLGNAICKFFDSLSDYKILTIDFRWDSDEFKEAVREQQKFYLDAGIHSVPAVILNDRILIQGAQPVEHFKAALLQASNE